MNFSQIFSRLLFFSVLFLFLSPPVQAQELSNQMRYAVSGDSVLIYHIKSLQAGHGFNIFRKEEGQSTFNQLNDEPIRGVVYANELPSALGEGIYEEISNALTIVNARDMFFTLRSNSAKSRLYTFVYPEVAEATGRLFVDRSVSVGDRVTYKIEFVNDLGEPTGETIIQDFLIDNHTPVSPTNLKINNEGYRVTAEWEYPQMGNEDDKVIRFNVYSQNPQTEELSRVNQGIILRESDKTAFKHGFQTESLGKELTYFVTAVDITGEAGPPSEKVTHYLEDDIAPSTIDGVKAEYIDATIEVTWPVSPEADLAGYYIYKSNDVSNGYRKVNEVPINALETVYRDSSIETGNRYFYRITAVDSAGNESLRSAAAMRHIADTTPPPNPEELGISFTDDGLVVINWSLNPKPSDLRRFIVLRSRKAEGDKTSFSQLTDRDFLKYSYEDIGVADKGFTEGAFYTYGIVAADSSRNFSDTTFVDIQIPDLTPPQKPTFVRADNDDGIRVNVSWNATSSGDAVQYIAYRQPLDSSMTEIKKLPIRTTQFRHEKVSLGKKYRYAISAVDSVGNESSPAFSDTVWVRDYDPPRSVRNVTVEPMDSGTGYTIDWEPVVAADLKGYKIYYSNISTGVYKPITDSVLGSTTYKYSNGKTGHWIRVVAVDISGNESKPSEPVKVR